MTYTGLSQENLYDVAAKLYNGDTSLGLQDLITLNPTINPSADLQGIVLNYTAGLKRATQTIIAVTPIIAEAPIYRVGERQSIYDLATQLFGNAQKITEIIGYLSDLNGEITAGFSFPYTPSIDPIALLFAQRGVVVATSPVIIAATARRLLEDGSYRLLETGDYRLLE